MIAELKRGESQIEATYNYQHLGGRDLVSAFRPNAIDFPQARRLGLDQVKYVLAEHLDHPLGVDRPDAPDHAGAQVFLDAIK